MDASNVGENSNRSKDEHVGRARKNSQTKNRKAEAGLPSCVKPKLKTRKVAKQRRGLTTFKANLKKFWDKWSAFKTKTPETAQAACDEPLGVPGFEEISCIEAEVPDIMMMDKDRVRTSCKECIRDLPTFPTKDEIKAKLIAADKCYGVESSKTPQSELEQNADYVDETIARPSWRFILERPLVEQYVLMTNYIRKVSVLSELKEGNPPPGFVENEESGSDGEYKKFEQRFVRERNELLKPIRKPQTREIATQASFQLKEYTKEQSHESNSEISVYPESDHSTHSPEASAITIVTSRDYSSPLQSDIEGRTTDRSTNHRAHRSSKDGRWWNSTAACQQSEWHPTSTDSMNINTSSGTDGQSVPIHSTPSKVYLQSAETEDPKTHSQAKPFQKNGGPVTTTRQDKRVTFSSTIKCYQGTATINLRPYQNTKDVDIFTPTNRRLENVQEYLTTSNSTDDQITENPPVTKLSGNNTQVLHENLLMKENHEPKQFTVKRKQLASEKNMTLREILQDTKEDQIMSVTKPLSWQGKRLLKSQETVSVVVSRPPQPIHPLKKIDFQEFDEIPDIDFSEDTIKGTAHRNGTNIQTQTSMAQKDLHTHHIRQRRCSLVTEEFGPLQEGQRNFPNSPFFREKIETKMPNAPFIATGQISPYVNGEPANLNSGELSSERKNARTDNIRSVPHYEMKDRSRSESSIKAKEMSDCKGEIKNKINSETAFFHAASPHKSLNKRLSTDTEGSSTSNEHLKLKPSPACFFKVATPTDLTRISVDEFYPEVPEINVESKAEEKLISYPCSGIPFAKVEVHCENTKMLGLGKIKTDGCHKKEISCSEMGINALDVVENSVAKTRTMINTEQQSNITQSSKKTDIKDHPSKGNSNKHPRNDIRILENEIKSLNENKLSSNEVDKSAKPVEFKPTIMQIDATKMTKDGEVNEQQKSSNRTDPVLICDAKNEPNEALSHKNELVPDGGCDERGENDKRLEIKKYQFTKGEVAKKPQMENTSNQFENQHNLGKGRIMRVLSTLAEESSVTMESTSSTQKPVTGWSVEGLKSKFEKKSTSVELQKVEEDCHKWQAGERKLSNNGQRLIDEKFTSAENVMGASQAGETITKTESQNQVGKRLKYSHLLQQNSRSITPGNGTGSESLSHVGLSKAKDPLQDLSQIDVMRPSQIYSTASMYTSTSDDRLNKGRAVFQPVTLDDNLEGDSGCQITGDDEKNEYVQFESSITEHVWNETTSPLRIQNEVKIQAQGTIHRDTSVPPNNPDDCGTPTNPTHGSRDPRETKRWLMDVIPNLPRASRRFKTHKPKELTEAEAVKFRQEAVKPVFRFLKKQRHVAGKEK